MPDREYVARRLGELSAFIRSQFDGLTGTQACELYREWAVAAEQAAEMLKAQEPRVMALEKMREGEVYWFECPKNFVLRPVICNMYDRGDSSYLNFVWLYGNFSWKICEYGRIWRCWTQRPTDEQREATAWQVQG